MPETINNIDTIIAANDLGQIAIQTIEYNRLIIADLDKSVLNFVSPEFLKTTQEFIINNLETINNKINLITPQIHKINIFNQNPICSTPEMGYFSNIYNIYIENANNLWQVRNDRINILNCFNEHHNLMRQTVLSHNQHLENQYLLNRFKIDYLTSSNKLTYPLTDIINLNCKLGLHNSHNII